MPVRSGRRLFGSGRIAAQSATGSIAIAAITAGCFALRLGFNIPCLLFLIVIVVQSLRFGFASSAVVSVLAVACLEYFFIPPVLEWQIDNPEDGVALAAYWLTALVITRLASRARGEAVRAERKRKQVGLLYETANRLLMLDPEMAAGPESLHIFGEVFGLRAVCFFDSGTADSTLHGESFQRLAKLTRTAATSGSDFRDPTAGVWVQVVRSGRGVAGAVGFEGCFEDDEVILPLSVLAATAMERMRSYRSATRAAADARAEALRSAILDAFAHEFKTPLAIILAAAGGLRELSGSGAADSEMTEIIESQTLRLSRLTTRLLRMARLDSEEVMPQTEPLNLRELLEGLIEPGRLPCGDRIEPAFSAESPVVQADPELLSLAITQLLDNACKYSDPATVVRLNLTEADGSACIRISNEGPAIPDEERGHLFDRFFRGTATEGLAGGAGLGLYVARKIVRAHGGSLELERAGPPTTFQIRVPVLPKREST